MNFRKIVFLFLVVFCFLTLSNFISAYNEQVFDSVNNYYSSFMEKDLDTYMSYNYLDEYSDELISKKRESLLNLWNNFDVLDYSIDNFQTDIYQDIAVVHYTLNSVMKFSDSDSFEEHKNISMLLLHLDSKWKVVIGGEKDVVDSLLDSYLTDVRFYVNDTLANTSLINNSDFLDNVSLENDSVFSNGNLTFNSSSIVCDYDKGYFLDVNNYSISGFLGSSFLVNDGDVILFSVDDDSYYYVVENGSIYFLMEDSLTFDHHIITDSCTISRIIDGSNPMTEYDLGNIVVETEGVFDSIKLAFGKIFMGIYSWFNPTPVSLWIEAESGVLTGGRSDFIGPTGRGPGELYLARGNSYITYTFDVPKTAEYNLYISYNDDALHSDGSRDASFIFNDGTDESKLLKFKHVSLSTQTNDSYFAWTYLGKVKLSGGVNKLKVVKDKSTSAAFVMDRFVLSETELSFG